MRYLQRILYLTTQFFCIDPKHRTPRRMECPSEDVCREVVIFSRKVLKDRLQLPWMATGAVPVRIRTAISLFVENSHLETRHQGVMFRSPRAFVGSTATLRYEPCTQFINVSQRALHIYFIDGCRRIKSKTKTRQYGSIAKNLLSRYSISSK